MFSLLRIYLFEVNNGIDLSDDSLSFTHHHEIVPLFDKGFKETMVILPRFTLDFCLRNSLKPFKRLRMAKLRQPL